MLTIETLIAETGRDYSALRDKYKGAGALYARAAAIASQSLNREVREYEIAMIELAMSQAKIALQPTERMEYTRAATLLSIAARYAGERSSHFAPTNMAEVVDEMEEQLSAQIMAQKLRPPSPQAPKVDDPNATS